MLLGLPSGFNDASYIASMDSAVRKPMPEHELVFRCAIIAGKVVDRNAGPTKPSFAAAMDLDEQMDAMAAAMPDGWWDVPRELPTQSPEVDNLRTRLLQQFYYFHVKMYIHLPFIAASSTTATRHNVSKLVCLDASRQMLRRFLLLRTEIQGAPIFECMTSDFVGFTAAVVLLLCLPDQDTSDEDRQLISATQSVFREIETKSNGRMASQCRHALEMLSAAHKLTPNGRNEIKDTQDVAIPYFGTVVLKHVNRAQTQAYPATAQINPADNATEGWGNLGDASLEYLGPMANPVMSGIDALGGYQENAGLSFWQDLGMVDIDQDWSLFGMAGMDVPCG